MIRRRSLSAFAAMSAVCLGAVVVGGGHAEAYVRTTTELNKPMIWPSPCIFLTAYVGDPPPNLLAGQFLGAARSAAATWSRGALACTGVSIDVDSTAAAADDVAYDRKNRVMFRRNSWCKQPREPNESCYEAAALAITSVFAKKTDGVILDADVEINAVNFSWADVEEGGTPALGAQDVQNTLTHEFGHLIGLDHNCFVSDGVRPRPLDNQGQSIPDCSQASATVREATMFASVIRGDTTRRTLAADDAKAACDVYPASWKPICSRPADDDESGGGCAVARPGPRARDGGFGALLAIGLALVLVRRRLIG